MPKVRRSPRCRGRFDANRTRQVRCYQEKSFPWIGELNPNTYDVTKLREEKSAHYGKIVWYNIKYDKGIPGVNHEQPAVYVLPKAAAELLYFSKKFDPNMALDSTPVHVIDLWNKDRTSWGFLHPGLYVVEGASDAIDAFISIPTSMLREDNEWVRKPPAGNLHSKYIWRFRGLRGWYVTAQKFLREYRQTGNEHYPEGAGGESVTGGNSPTSGLNSGSTSAPDTASEIDRSGTKAEGKTEALDDALKFEDEQRFPWLLALGGVAAGAYAYSKKRGES